MATTAPIISMSMYTVYNIVLPISLAIHHLRTQWLSELHWYVQDALNCVSLQALWLQQHKIMWASRIKRIWLDGMHDLFRILRPNPTPPPFRPHQFLNTWRMRRLVALDLFFFSFFFSKINDKGSMSLSVEIPISRVCTFSSPLVMISLSLWARAYGCWDYFLIWSFV